MSGMHSADDAILWQQGRAITYSQLLQRAALLARAVPAAGFVLNLCESRLAFLTAFLMAAQRGQITLLPSNRAPLALADIQAAYPDHCVLTDESVGTALQSGSGAVLPEPGLTIPADREVAIVFTSGSTGKPEGHVKHWRTLVDTARLTSAILEGKRYHMVATIPSQHMYGFETTTMLTLVSGGSVSDARPFFPQDIGAELAALPAPRIWVTTPAHLRTCVAAGIQLPELELILSATAPLDAGIAAAAEELWKAPVHEIYGCTEAGTVAWRRTTQSAKWKTYPGTRIEQTEERAFVHGAHLPGPVALQDRFALDSPTQFTLLGRSADMVKVAGKRASLADLTQCLLKVPGVVDGIVFVPQEEGRPAALAAAPGVSRETILAGLAERLDAAFLPRPLVLVDALPRNEAGKLPRAALLAAIGHTADPPYLEGHFPGNPIVPGVVILEQVFEELRTRHSPQLKLRGIDAAKFPSSLRPGETLSIETTAIDSSTVRFRCHVQQRVVAEGAMRVEMTT